MSSFKSIFIDESGNGSNCQDKNNLWVTAGVCVDMDKHDDLSSSFLKIKKDCITLYNKEMKGSDLVPSRLNEGVTIDDVARRVGKLIEDFDLNVWITSTRYNPDMPTRKFTPSNPSAGVLPKDIARELLMERVSGYANLNNDCKFIIIWDFSDGQEQFHFSRLIGEYVNPHSGERICGSIIPNILGGLSHEWPELQICDLVANFALNYVADGKLDDCVKEKSIAFKKHIYPRLMCGSKGIEGIGWKTYYI